MWTPEPKSIFLNIFFYSFPWGFLIKAVLIVSLYICSISVYPWYFFCGAECDYYRKWEKGKETETLCVRGGWCKMEDKQNKHAEDLKRKWSTDIKQKAEETLFCPAVILRVCACVFLCVLLLLFLQMGALKSFVSPGGENICFLVSSLEKHTLTSINN